MRVARERQKKNLGICPRRAGKLGGLVLGCIEASDSESRRIFHDFSRSTRFSPLRTALNPKFQQKLAKNFPYFLQKFRKILLNFVQILLNFNEISPEFHQNFTPEKTTVDTPEKTTVYLKKNTVDTLTRPVCL